MTPLARPLAAALLAVLCTVPGLVVATSAPATAAPDRYRGYPIEGYAQWQPQRTCRHTALAGTRELARWLASRGGRPGPLMRACGSGGASEHKDGRAIDWMLDASRPREARVAAAFVRLVRGTDEHGNADALARRMGIMYIIWDDRIWSAWRHFQPEAYLSNGCRTRRRCSDTLRHRDHVHVSLSRAGGRGRTSWFLAR